LTVRVIDLDWDESQRGKVWNNLAKFSRFPSGVMAKFAYFLRALSANEVRSVAKQVLLLL
jgi:hypothetical protein